MPWLLILLIIAAILLVAFVVFLTAMSYVERQEMRWLAQNGTHIQARIRELHSLVPAPQLTTPKATAEPLTSTTPASRHIIIAEWTDPSTEATYTFHSRPLNQLSEEYREGQLIAVFIDPAHPTRYALESDLQNYQQKHKYH